MPEELLPKPQTDLPLHENGIYSEDPIPDDIAENPIEVKKEIPLIKSHALTYFVLGVLFIIMLLTIGGAYLYGKNNDRQISSKSIKNNVVEDKVSQKNTDFFYFSIPKPFENLDINDLPNTFEPFNIIKVNGNLWFTSGGSIIEYDPKENKLVSYSNLAKANCDRNILYVNNFVYAVCRTDNIDDAFETSRVLNEKKYMGHYSILKIDPKTHEIVRQFDDKDGLRNRYNFKLYEDEDYIWTETFNGVARLNTNTDKIDFWDKELGTHGTHFGISKILPDIDFVWVNVNSNVYSEGGMSKFDKKTGSWEAFGPNELNDPQGQGYAQFDAEYGKIVPNGIQIGFRQGPDKLVQKKYNYTTKTWTKIDEFPVTGNYSAEATKKLKEIYPAPDKFTYLDEYGLSQIKMPDTNEIFKIDGRNNLILSQMIDGKRYVVTNGTLDSIDNSYPFRKLLIKLPSPSKKNSQYNDFMEGQISLLIDPKLKLSIITDASCGGMGCSGNEKIWLIDLNTEKLLKTYTSADNIPAGEELFDLNLSNDSTYLLVANKTGYIFKINLKDNSIIKVEKSN